jgi:arylsulfatase A-like enzyme
MTFRRAYCQQAVCSPSRTSLLTGLRPDTTRVYDLETHFRKTIPDAVTLPQRFLQAGYHTVGMGKIYHSGLDDAASWSEPWSTVNRPAYASAESMALIQSKRQQAKTKGLKAKAANRAARGPAFEAGDVEDNFYTDGAQVEKAIARMEQLAGGEKPFFLAVGFHKPHLPFISPKRYHDLYPLEKISVAGNPFHPKGAPPYALTNSGELRAYEGMPKSGPVDDETAKRLRQAYYACVSYTDANIGHLLDGIDHRRLVGRPRLEAGRAWRMVQALDRGERHARGADDARAGPPGNGPVERRAGGVRRYLSHIVRAGQDRRTQRT